MSRKTLLFKCDSEKGFFVLFQRKLSLKSDPSKKLQGLAMGVLDTGGNVSLMRLHGKEVAPYMQTMHFLFGLGAFASP